MDRSWMYGDRRDKIYIDGVKNFCNVALQHSRLKNCSTIFCPCRDCANLKRWGDINKIEDHLYRRGFTRDYETWYWHGEKISFGNHNNVVGENDVSEHQCLDSNDGDDVNMGGDQINDMFCAIGDHIVNEQPRMFEDVSKAAKTPLYPGCRKYSKLSAVLTLANLKAKYGWTDTSFNSLLETLADMFPEGNELPRTTYYAKKLINPLGLEYTKIHACPNDCVLYRKEYENLDACPICGHSRYVRKEGGSNGKKLPPPPAKVLRYLPIIPRFRRLFSIEDDAKNLVWHEEGRKKDGLIRHPADSNQWAHINKTFPVFGAESRNLRLGLSTDGMNPYGTLSSIHSTWPVLLTIYNLPPWLCMKRKYIMLTLLISGPKQPGNDIDVYLAPLIDDLKHLWDEGVPMFDAYTRTNFTLRAMIFCTINDFPAYGNLSGYKVRSEKACPICDDDMKPQYLTFSSKNVYMHTRRFLPRFHPYRKMKAQFNGNTEDEIARGALSGMQLFERVRHMSTIFGKCVKSKSVKAHQWKKRSIFWDLPYWTHLSVRHCLDVMHIEKNVCDSVVGTLLNIPKKTKDGLKVRRDMQQLNIRPKLWPEYNAAKTTAYLPRACYTLSKEHKRIFLECLYDIKVPTGYSSNIKRFVSVTDQNSLSGMKSHDCHVLMQVFLPIALRGILSKHVRQPIVKLCLFFDNICRKVIDPKELDTLQEDLVETLCKFEMYFPPSFFDIMVHLVIHLVREVKECGPVFLRWMYPMERYMGVLKGFMKNRAKPEGSIVERFMAEEASNFCAVFLDMAKEIGIPESRHEGRLQGHGTIGRKEIRPPSDRFHKAHRCVLQHLSEVHPYLERHISELKARNPRGSSYAILQEHNRTFVKWFQTHVYLQLKTNNDVTPTIEALSRGPQAFVTSFQGYDINGFCFYTKLQDDKGVHQNSSVMLVASSTEYSTARDNRPIDATQVYYGVIQEIWELDYLEFKIPVLRCKWVDNRHGVKVSDDGMTLVDSNRFVDTSEPFVLASLAKQIFYVRDNIDRQWFVVVQGKRKIVGVEEVVDEEDYDQFDATPPLSIGVQPLPHGEDVVEDEVYDRDEGTYVDVTVD